MAVKSCLGDYRVGCHQTIRETWGQGIDVKFFLSPQFFLLDDCPKLKDDEILVDCPDDYNHLPQKTQQIVRWFLYRDYDHIFLCDVDTFIIPSKLLKTGFEDYDYAGRIGSDRPFGKPFRYRDGRKQWHAKCYAWASGGYGYFLSKTAAEIVTCSIIDPRLWAEDMFVGDALAPHYAQGKITVCDLSHFENEVSWHYPAHQLGWNRTRMQLWMRDMHGLYNDPNHQWAKI